MKMAMGTIARVLFFVLCTGTSMFCMVPDGCSSVERARSRASELLIPTIIGIRPRSAMVRWGISDCPKGKSEMAVRPVSNVTGGS